MMRYSPNHRLQATAVRALVARHAGRPTVPELGRLARKADL